MYFQNPGSGTLQAGNAGLTSNAVGVKCWASPPCTYTLSASSEGFTADGGADSVGVITDPGPNQSTCPWNATSNAPWIAIVSGPSGRGNGQVSFTVAPNTDAARQGTMTIGGQTFTINQDAGVTPAPSARVATTTPESLQTPW